LRKTGLGRKNPSGRFKYHWGFPARNVCHIVLLQHKGAIQRSVSEKVSNSGPLRTRASALEREITNCSNEQCQKGQPVDNPEHTTRKLAWVGKDLMA
jgi:hypothetical protein